MKNKTGLVILLMSFLIVSHLQGQSIFIKTFGFGRMNEAYAVTQTADKGYAITGSTTGSWNEIPDMYLMRTDSTGAYLWSHLYGGNNIDQCKSSIQLSDKGFLLAGYTNSFSLNNDYDAYFVRTDSMGNEKWSRSFGTTSWELLESVVETSDNAYVAAGTSYATSDGHPTGWIIKTDTLGNILWENLLNLSVDISLTNIIPTQDGNFVACGYYKDPVPNREQAFAVKIDGFFGDTLWTYYYHGPNATRLYSSGEFSSGSLAFCGYLFLEADTNKDEFVLGLTPSGTEHWQHYFHENGKTEGFNHLCILNDQIYTGGSTSTFGSGNQDYHFMRIDSMGNYLFATNWGGNDDEICYHFTPTADTGFALVGTTKSFGPSFQSVMLVKTNRSLTTTNVVTINVGEIENSFTLNVYPNPFRDKININLKQDLFSGKNLNTIRLFSSTGNLLQNFSTSENECSISCPELSAGIYLLQIQDAQGKTRNVRLVKTE